MFYYLNGTVAELLPGMAVMDCGGVGYACRTTSNTLSALKRGQSGKLYTFLHVGDAIFDLYGFCGGNQVLHLLFRNVSRFNLVGYHFCLADFRSGFHFLAGRVYLCHTVLINIRQQSVSGLLFTFL